MDGSNQTSDEESNTLTTYQGASTTTFATQLNSTINNRQPHSTFTSNNTLSSANCSYGTSAGIDYNLQEKESTNISSNSSPLPHVENKQQQHPSQQPAC